MARRPQVDFLFDVDNTLLDNDAAQADYRAYLERESGADAAARYWAIFLELRQELGYADYLGALQRYRLERLHDPRVLLMSSFLLDYPFADRLYPGALDVIAHCGRVGRSVVVTDGDVVFQPRKVERAGIRRAVQDRVLICLHKEREARRRRASLSRRPLCVHRRQAPDSHGREGAVGIASHNHFCPTGPLRARPSGLGRLSGGRSERLVHRRSAGSRSADVDRRRGDPRRAGRAP